MEKIVSASRAPVFQLRVLSDNQKPKTRKPKVFSNDHIEKVSVLGELFNIDNFIVQIVVSGPCNFYLQLKMKNLR